MWRSKKFIGIVLLATILLVGSIAGVALAQTDNDEVSPPMSLLARVATKLGIGEQVLRDAIAEARSEMQDEALQQLVNEGKITQDQADQLREWQQARPDMEPFHQQLREWEQARPDVPPELKDWLQSRPDIPLPMPHQRNLPFRGFHGGPCIPPGFDGPPDTQ